MVAIFRQFAGCVWLWILKIFAPIVILTLFYQLLANIQRYVCPNEIEWHDYLSITK